MASGNSHDLVHGAGLSGIVYGHDGLGPLGDSGLDQPLVQIKGIFPDIYEHGHPAAQGKGIGRGHKGERGHDDLVAWTDVAQDGRHFKGSGAGMGQQGLWAAQPIFQPGMAFLGERPVTGSAKVHQHGLGDIR